MAVIVDAVKRFQSERVVVYSYANYDDPSDSGVILVDRTNINSWELFPPGAFRPTAELPLIKAYGVFRATGEWPESVRHVS
jgi:hypothetical protein